ncbi:MAG: type I-E CRISPR-associated endoribonuclease Cas2e [Eubacteriales bacterium]
MPFTVITLKKVPNSLRGDLTRWMQEIATGVYVGNFNSRVREALWQRIIDTVGDGEATMSFAFRNEIGYSFQTINAARQVVDYDGIPLVLLPSENDEERDSSITAGFSNASKMHRARRVASPNIDNVQREYVFLDIETTGLDVEKDRIIEVGSIKVSGEKEVMFQRLIKTEIEVPDVIENLTGINGSKLSSEGIELKQCIAEFMEFIGKSDLIGYNIRFDIKFLNKALSDLALAPIHNKTIDLMQEAKKRNMFQINYKLETTLREYGIDQTVQHRALKDAKLIYQLYKAMNGKEKN